MRQNKAYFFPAIAILMAFIMLALSSCFMTRDTRTSRKQHPFATSPRHEDSRDPDSDASDTDRPEKPTDGDGADADNAPKPDPGTTGTATTPANNSTAEPSIEHQNEIQTRLDSVAKPDLLRLPEQTRGPSASGLLSVDNEPYWKQETNPMRLAVMELIHAALEAGQTSIDIAAAFANYYFDQKELDDAIYSMFHTVVGEDPRFFYYDPNYSSQYYYNIVDGGRSYSSYVLNYRIRPAFATKEAIDQAWAALNAEANQIALCIMKMTDNDWYRLRLAHDYILSHTVYSPTSNWESNQVYDALLGSESMCVGYTQAFKMIVSRMGFPTAYVVGYAGKEAHAWSKVKLYDQWYNVDVTWNDPQQTGPVQGLFQTYFLRADQNMWDHQIYNAPLPTCPDDYLAYYEANHSLIQSAEELEAGIYDFLTRSDLQDEKPEIYEYITPALMADVNTLGWAAKAAIQRFFHIDRPTQWSYNVMADTGFVTYAP